MGRRSEPPPYHSIAFVNHSLSHGTLGDRFLSLNEAIQLHNRTLTFNQLSPGEQSQLSGNQDIAWIDIDAGQLPLLTMERDLDVIVDTPHGMLLRGYGGRPVIDFVGRTRGFVARSNYCGFENIEIRNAAYGVDLTQTNAPLGCTFQNVRFSGQTIAGVRARMLSTGGTGRLVMDRCHFDGVPTALTIDESGGGRTSQVLLSGMTTTGVQNGLHVRLGAGGVASYLLERMDLEALGPALVIERAPGGDRALILEGLQIAARGAPAMLLEGSAANPTTVLLRMLDLEGTGTGIGKLGLAIGPLGADVRGALEDSRVVGDLRVEVGGSQPLAIDNLFHAAGGAALGSSQGALGVSRALFVGSQVQTVGFAPVALASSCVQGGSVAGRSTAPLTLTDSFSSAPLGSHVTAVAPLASAQLGSFAVAPRRPLLGTFFTVTSDLPPGLLGFCALGTTAFAPQLLPERIYFDAFGAVTLGTPFRLQQAATVAIPALPSLVGSDWVVQMAVLPDPATAAPALSMPPGQRFQVW